MGLFCESSPASLFLFIHMAKIITCNVVLIGSNFLLPAHFKFIVSVTYFVVTSPIFIRLILYAFGPDLKST